KRPEGSEPAREPAPAAKDRTADPEKPPAKKPPEGKEAPKGDESERAQANFLGSQGNGRRFCIIADCSGSMNGKPIVQVQDEILKTPGALTPDCQFYVIFFSTKARPMPYPTWLNGGKENVDKVAPWVRSVGATGGTRPLPAFQAAFRLDPRPDVIFFMTDGI